MQCNAIQDTSKMYTKFSIIFAWISFHNIFWFSKSTSIRRVAYQMNLEIHQNKSLIAFPLRTNYSNHLKCTNYTHENEDWIHLLALLSPNSFIIGSHNDIQRTARKDRRFEDTEYIVQVHVKLPINCSLLHATVSNDIKLVLSLELS